MFKSIICLFFIVCSVFAAPKADPQFVAAPAVAPAYVTSQSSQVIARNYNALAAPVVAAPAVAAPVVAAPAVAAPVVAAPAVAAPVVAARAGYVASPYAYNPYAAAYVF